MSDSIDVLCWLEEWYQEQWDDVLERDLGFSVQTLDNPGWLVKAALGGLLPEKVTEDGVLVVVGEPPSAKNGNVGGRVWMTCEIKAGQFIGAGDLTQLREILAYFRKWVEGCN